MEFNTFSESAVGHTSKNVDYDNLDKTFLPSDNVGYSLTSFDKFSSVGYEPEINILNSYALYNEDPIIKLFTDPTLISHCTNGKGWKFDDYHCRNLYNIFYCEYYKNDTDPGIDTIKNGVILKAEKGIGYYIKEFYPLNSGSPDKLRKVINNTVNDFRNIHKVVPSTSTE